MIEQRGQEWFVMSEEGDELSGPFESEEAAGERLREIEAGKAASEDGPQLDLLSGHGTTISDGATVRRYDLLPEDLHTDKHRTTGIYLHTTDEGFLRGEARWARTGVQTYGDAEGNTWGEYRDASEVFSEDSLRSYDLAVVTNDHPAKFVDTDNRADVDVGAIGNDARRDGRFVRASVVIRDKNTIQAIKDGKRQLSMGYTARVIVGAGVTDDGTPYAGRQTNIRINHGAIVDKGRAGPEVGLELARGDAFTTILPAPAGQETPMSDENETQTEDAAAPVETPAPAVDHTADLSALRAKVDMLEATAKADAESFTARVDARATLVADARSVLGSEFKLDTDAGLMAAIVAKAAPSMASKLDANKGDVGYLRCAYDQAMEIHAKRDEQVNATHSAIFDTVTDGDKGDPILDALRSYNTRAQPRAEA